MHRLISNISHVESPDIFNMFTYIRVFYVQDWFPSGTTLLHLLAFTGYLNSHFWHIVIFILRCVLLLVMLLLSKRMHIHFVSSFFLFFFSNSCIFGGSIRSTWNEKNGCGNVIVLSVVINCALSPISFCVFIPWLFSFFLSSSCLRIICLHANHCVVGSSQGTL